MEQRDCIKQIKMIIMIKERIKNIAKVGLAALLLTETSTVFAKDTTLQLDKESPYNEETSFNDNTSNSECENDFTFVPYRNDKQINRIRKEFVIENYDRIVKEQREQFALENYPVPEYFFGHVNSNSSLADGAMYYPDDNRILMLLSNGRKEKNLDYDHKLFEDYNCFAVEPEEINSDTEFAIRHELAHAYFYSEVRKPGSTAPWRIIKTDYANPSHIAIKMITEGFAEYIAKKGTQKSNVNKDDLLECSDEDMRNVPLEYGTKYEYDHLYTCGYTLVAPILNANFKEGLQALLLHPPRRADIEDLVKYRTKLLSELHL